MTSRWTRVVLLPTCAVMIVAAMSCGGDDPGPVCKPRALIYDNDSVTYTYTDNRITTVKYYTAGRQTNEDGLTYNSNGQLVTVSKLNIAFDGTQGISSHHTLQYGSDGHPLELVSNSLAGNFKTKFTHNEHGQLALAVTTSGIQEAYVGTTRYQYDANGNIPKVYYTLRLNGQITEVLARENLSFDDNEKYYINSTELKIANEYIYGYLPNRNNCLSATVYYYSYQQHFANPLSISFVASYDDQARIKSLQADGPNTRLYSGEVLFKDVLYDCR